MWGWGRGAVKIPTAPSKHFCFVFVGFVNSGLNTNAIVQWWGLAGRGRVWVGSAGAEPASADGEFLGILRAST